MTPRATTGSEAENDRQDKRRRRREVLDTAARMFAEFGYDGTTSRAIGDELGLLRGSIYYYFESKELLLYELIQEVWAGAMSYLDEILASDGDPVQKLSEVLRRHVLYLTDNTVNASLFLHEARSLSEEHRKVVAAEEERYQRGILKLIKDGQKQGLIRGDVDAKLAMFELLGAVNWTYRWYRKGRGAAASKVADQFATMLLDGLAPRA